MHIRSNLVINSALFLDNFKLALLAHESYKDETSVQEDEALELAQSVFPQTQELELPDDVKIDEFCLNCGSGMQSREDFPEDAQKPRRQLHRLSDFFEVIFRKYVEFA